MELFLYIVPPMFGTLVGFVLGCAACGRAHATELAAERAKVAKLRTQLWEMGRAMHNADVELRTWETDRRLAWEELKRVKSQKGA